MLDRYTTDKHRKKANEWRTQYNKKLAQNKAVLPSSATGSITGGRTVSPQPAVNNDIYTVYTPYTNKNIALPYEDTVWQKNEQKKQELTYQQQYKKLQQIADGVYGKSDAQAFSILPVVLPPQAAGAAGIQNRTADINRTTAYGPNSEMAKTVKLADNTAKTNSYSMAQNKSKRDMARDEYIAALKNIYKTSAPQNRYMPAVPRNIYKPVVTQNSYMPAAVQNSYMFAAPNNSYMPATEIKDKQKTNTFLKNVGGGFGPNKETAYTVADTPPATGFLEKELYAFKYGTDNIETVNHTNTYITKDARPIPMVVNTENSVRTARQKLDKLSITKNEELKKLEFEKNSSIASIGYKGSTEYYDRQIKQVAADIKRLEVCSKKLSLGYELCRKNAEILSTMNEADILEYIRQNNEEPLYNGHLAKTVRAANQGVDRVSAAVGILEKLDVKYIKLEDEFTVGDTEVPGGGFSFFAIKADKLYDKNARRIIVDRSQLKRPDSLQMDLANAIDGSVISGKTYDILKNLADENKSIKTADKYLGRIGRGLDILDFVIIVGSDFKDDGTLGTDTAQEFFGTSAAWAGDYIGGTAGAKAGAAIGAVFGPAGAVIGTALGAFAGAYILSSAMEEAGRYVGENITTSDYTIERYYQRGK